MIIIVTCHYDLVLNVGPTMLGPRLWQLSSEDPGWCILHQELSGGEVVTAIPAPGDQHCLKYY